MAADAESDPRAARRLSGRQSQPVMRAPALAELREIRLAARLSWSRENIYRCDTANAAVRKEASLAYKITRISLVPLFGCHLKDKGNRI
jgi:hypothetical protein